MKIGIISSPFARDCRRNPDFNQELCELLGDQGPFRVSNSKSSLDKVCQEFAALGIDHVGIVGGDGTLSFVISALAEAYGPDRLPRIIPLIAGTANFFKQDIQLGLKAKSCLAKVLKNIQLKKPLYYKKIFTIRAENRLGFLFATGLPTLFLKDFYNSKTGLPSTKKMVQQFFCYVLDAFLGGRLCQRFCYIQKGFSLIFRNHQRHTMIFVGTIKTIPLGVKLFSHLVLGEPVMAYVGVRAFGLNLTGKCVKIFLKRRLSESKDVDQMKLKEISLATTDDFFSYSMDGDLLQSSSRQLHLTLGPAVTFCSPTPTESNSAL